VLVVDDQGRIRVEIGADPYGYVFMDAGNGQMVTIRVGADYAGVSVYGNGAYGATSNVMASANGGAWMAIKDATGNDVWSVP
jgi:hypothetical protein